MRGSRVVWVAVPIAAASRAVRSFTVFKLCWILCFHLFLTRRKPVMVSRYVGALPSRLEACMTSDLPYQ